MCQESSFISRLVRVTGSPGRILLRLADHHLYKGKIAGELVEEFGPAVTVHSLGVLGLAWGPYRPLLQLGEQNSFHAPCIENALLPFCDGFCQVQTCGSMSFLSNNMFAIPFPYSRGSSIIISAADVPWSLWCWLSC